MYLAGSETARKAMAQVSPISIFRWILPVEIWKNVGKMPHTSLNHHKSPIQVSFSSYITSQDHLPHPEKPKIEKNK